METISDKVIAKLRQVLEKDQDFRAQHPDEWKLIVATDDKNKIEAAMYAYRLEWQTWGGSLGVHRINSRKDDIPSYAEEQLAFIKALRQSAIGGKKTDLVVVDEFKEHDPDGNY